MAATIKKGLLVLALTTMFATPAMGIAPVDLKTACNYAILAKSGISTVTTSNIIGDIGVSPIAATGITGFSLTLDASTQFSTSSQITGKAFAPDYAVPTPGGLTDAVLQMQAAYTDAASRMPDSVNYMGGLIGGETLTAGVYAFKTAINIYNDIYFHGGVDDVWIIQTTGVLTLAANTKVILSGDAQAKNIFWQVAGNAVIGADALMQGILLVFTDVVLETGSSLNGLIFAQTAVNLQMAKINGGDSCTSSSSASPLFTTATASTPFTTATVSTPFTTATVSIPFTTATASITVTAFETGGGGVQGDPHFKTWRGQRFDYHGECDLVLLHSSEFGSGLGLDVHIRTKIRRDMSYISSATVRMGTDILEVASQGIYYLNGEAGAELPDYFSGFTLSHTQPTDKQHVFEVQLGGSEKIKVKTYKDFVSVLIEQGQSEHFGDSVGLMGDFRNGHMIARDGKSVLDDANNFGQEWQVLDTEPILFQHARLPQHPMECTLPTPIQASQLRRRLLESSVDELAAEKACAHWGEGKDDCVFDVLKTGDPAMAVVGTY
jgi:hypothetical protein